MVRVENVAAPDDYISEVLARVKPEYLLKTYKISSWTDHVDFLEQVAKRYGKLLKVKLHCLSPTSHYSEAVKKRKIRVALHHIFLPSNFVSPCQIDCQEWCRNLPTESIWLGVSWCESLENFLITPVCPMEKVTVRVIHPYVTPISETDNGIVKDKVFARTGNWTRDPTPTPSMVSMKPSLHPVFSERRTRYHGGC